MGGTIEWAKAEGQEKQPALIRSGSKGFSKIFVTSLY
jgi:hypothetical protein